MKFKKTLVPAPTPSVPNVKNFFTQPSSISQDNFLNLALGQWGINGVAVTATAADLNSAGGGSLPFNGAQIFVSKLFGDDLNTGSYGSPLATLNAANTLANTLSNNCTINIIDSEIYNEQLVITSDFSVNIYGPTAVIEYTGPGFAITYNNNAFNFLSVGITIGFNGGIQQNSSGATLINCMEIGGDSDAISCLSGEVFFYSLIVEGNLTATSGSIIGACLETGATLTGDVVLQTIDSVSGDWNITGNLNAGGYNYPMVGVTNAPAGYVLATDGSNNFSPQAPSSSFNSTDINFSSLSSAGTINMLVNNSVSSQFVITDIILNGGSGTNFSGGDRDLDITDGTNVWTTIPASSLEGLVNARLGSLDVPYSVSIPANQFSVPGVPIYATYSGGTTDYTAGDVSISLIYTQVTP